MVFHVSFIRSLYFNIYFLSNTFHEYVRPQVCLTPYQIFRPGLDPNCLLIFSVVGKGSDTVRPPVVLEQPQVFHRVACVVSIAMARENRHAIRFQRLEILSLSIMVKSIMHFHQFSRLVFKQSCAVIQNVNRFCW